ncbi:MAG: GNAT family N-acetyltransferase [Chloroflexi bacterium]|nr:MAG: GNAT family N-acetyltransferase [Chloroflexota bacterium]
MVAELVPARVDPVTAGRELWKRYHDFRRVRHTELRPEDPLEPDEVVEAQMKKPNPFDVTHYFEMTRGGQMVSWLDGQTVAPANPEYETNKHLFWADAYVRPEHRRQGIGALWLPVVARLMDEHGCTVVGMHSDQDSGHGFIKWLGAESKLTEIESRLKLSEVDWAMLERWAAEGRQRSPQTKLEIYDGPLPEAMWPEFAAQRSTLLNTIPFEGLDIGNIVVTPERIREHYERAALVGEVGHDVMTREPDGVISGMTDVSWASYRRTLIYQQFTGVLPSARGRGIGKWIKAAMVLHIRELYPDAEWIVTDNAHSNGPMLKINRTMGFKPSRTGIDYQMSRDQLGARL